MQNMQIIQMSDVTAQYQRLKPEIDKSIHDVISSGLFINGPEVKAFSRSLANYLDAEFVVPCGNGTDALQAALMALELKPGDEVITSTFSFIASVEVISLLGLKPVLVDVDPSTYNIDPDAVENAITERTRAIIPVHIFGQPAPMQDIMQIAAKYDLFVIEDVAQALGAKCFINGSEKQAGTIGHVGCTSFFPSKNLGCFGDGGACFTNDENLAEKLGMIVNHGARVKYSNEIVGMNSRLDTIQAAVLNVKLKHLDDFIKRRRMAAEVYYQELSDVSFLQLPVKDQKVMHTFNQFTVRVFDENREKLKLFLKEKGIPAMVYYPIPLHLQPVFSPFFHRDFSLPVGEMLCSQVLSLPMHTELTSEKQLFITDTIKQFL